MSYTKGEWKARKLFNRLGHEIWIVECNRILIARDLTEANAQLIVASPDLYEACKEAYSFCDDRVRFKIKKALAKAEGKDEH